MDRREYVCNQMYKQYDLLRKGSWTDADKLEYMELNIAPYSRYWRMGMKKALKHAIKLLREEEAEADRKTEPTAYADGYADGQRDERERWERMADRKTENSSEKPNNSTISKMEQVEDEPRLTAKCLNCANGGSYKCSKCDGEMYYKYDKDEPQTDCAWK